MSHVTQLETHTHHCPQGCGSVVAQARSAEDATVVKLNWKINHN